MLFKIGFRNIFRNLRRTMITVFALGVGIGALILADAFIVGTTLAMRNGVIDTLTGEVQLHHQKYLKSNDVEYNFDPADSIRKLQNNSSVVGYSKRVISGVMLASPQGSHNVRLYGVEPDREQKLVNIKKMVIKGEYLGNKKTILIGSALAKIMDLRVGEKISLTASDPKSGELVQELYRVGGIFHYGTRELDKHVAFISIRYADEMLKLNGKIHEIIIKTDGKTELKQLTKSLSDKDIEAKSWKDLTPSVVAAIEMSDFSSAIIATILLIIVAFGIMNTMFMSIYERTYEFGILKAIGTRPLQVFKMILVESFYLGGVGALCGIIIGYGLCFWLKNVGIDYSDVEMGAIGFSEPLKPVIELYQYIIFPTLFWLFTILVSIYPAVFATKINPVKAIKD